MVVRRHRVFQKNCETKNKSHRKVEYELQSWYKCVGTVGQIFTHKAPRTLEIEATGVQLKAETDIDWSTDLTLM